MKAFLFLTLFIFTSPSFAQSVEEGIEKYQNHSFQEAYEILKPFADHEVPEAMKYVGFMYWNGQGVALDYVKGCDYFEKVSEQGDVEAASFFGLCHVQDKGRPEDKNKAFQLLKKAYDSGYTRHQGMLGMLALDVGEWQLARKVLEPLAIAEDKDYMNIVGVMYRDGYGMAANHQIACKWFEKAAQQQLAAALHNYGDCFYFGLDRPVNKEEAYQLFKEAADLGSEKSKSAAEAVYKELYGQ